MTRIDPPWAGSEKATLVGFIQYHRDTLALKCEGLTPEQLAERAVPPSSMSLVGLVRHMTDVERNWFRRVIMAEGDDTAGPIHFVRDTNDDGDFDDASPDTVEADIATWRAEMAVVDGIIADLDDLGETRQRPGWEDMSVRWILVHMVEEYARHNGHADFLRERIDGATGE